MKKKLIVMAILIVLVLIAIIMILIDMNTNPKSKIVGSWTTDGVTIYKFNRNRTGVLIVSLGEYEFTYKINKDTLEINFKSEKSTDAKYTYKIDNDTLILNGDNGKFTFMRMNEKKKKNK